jgi:hypothetical protein
MPEIRTRTTRAESRFGTAPADGHPEEDLIDALRGGIRDVVPEGGAPALNLPRVHASRLI